MLANNELGTINDLGALVEVVRELAPGVPLHTDAVQAAPWLDLSQVSAAADLVSVSAHKLGGPKGTGALVVRSGTAVAPLLRGGGQERERRGGTHDVAGIVGFAAALGAARAERADRAAATAARRDRLADAMTELDGVRETVGPQVAAGLGGPADRSHLLPGHCHLLIDDVGGEELLLVLEQHGVCASAGSSCASGAIGASHVLAATGAVEGPGPGREVAALRLTLGADSTDSDVDATISALRSAVERIRSRATSARGPGGREPGTSEHRGRVA